MRDVPRTRRAGGTEKVSVSLERADLATTRWRGAGRCDRCCYRHGIRSHRGDVVYTSDFADLDRLRTYFPAVRVLAV